MMEKKQIDKFSGNVSQFSRIPPVGAMGNFVGGFFCWVLEIWREVILTIWTFFKAKNNILYILIIN